MRWLFTCTISVLINCGCQGQLTDRIELMIPSVEQETEYVWQTLQDMAFFQERGYDVSLPSGYLIEMLIAKSLQSGLTEVDYMKLGKFMEDSIYQISDYQQGYDSAVEGAASVGNMVETILLTPRNWEFKAFESYQILLTLYGPGGSYNPDEGTIVLYTTPTGKFKNYNDPTNTIIHEITHIGMEASIMIPLDIPHGLKERIVDTFVFLNFQDRLPEYRIQEMGDERFDEYVQTKEQLMDLRGIVESFETEK